MALHDFNLLSPEVPLIFSDGTDIYNQCAQEYIVHKKGYFILGPSGVGKTHFVKNQKEPHWIDGDILWQVAHAHPDSAWWLESPEIITEIDQRSDFITLQAKKLGFWITGTSNNWLKPDAIVIPHWSTHKRYIKHRENNNYDGGAKSDRLGQVLDNRNWIRQWSKKGVPIFKTMDEATAFLENEYKKLLDL